MAEHEIHRHSGAKGPDLAILLESAASENFDFVERTNTDWLLGANRFDADDEAFWTATTEVGQIVAMCGINIDPYVNNPMVGRLRHLYVVDVHRGTGLGAHNW